MTENTTTLNPGTEPRQWKKQLATRLEEIDRRASEIAFCDTLSDGFRQELINKQKEARREVIKNCLELLENGIRDLSSPQASAEDDSIRDAEGDTPWELILKSSRRLELGIERMTANAEVAESLSQRSPTELLDMYRSSVEKGNNLQAKAFESALPGYLERRAPEQVPAFRSIRETSVPDNIRECRRELTDFAHWALLNAAAEASAPEYEALHRHYQSLIGT